MFHTLILFNQIQDFFLFFLTVCSKFVSCHKMFFFFRNLNEMSCFFVQEIYIFFKSQLGKHHSGGREEGLFVTQMVIKVNILSGTTFYCIM